MVVKKIIKNAFEQITEAGKDMAKSSVKQIKETMSPWNMIRNSFTEGEGSKNGDQKFDKKEMQGKDKNHSPLNFKDLDKKYKTQDEQQIDQMKQKLFNLVNSGDQKARADKQNKTIQEQRQIESDENEKKRRQQSHAMPAGNAVGKMKGRRKKAAEPDPAEMKPGSSKQ